MKVRQAIVHAGQVAGPVLVRVGHDALHLLPTVCLTVGAWQIAPAAGWIVLGAMVWLDLQLPRVAKRRARR